MEARLDKWLWAARIYKTRTLAADACKNGRITINGAAAKPSRTVKAGDRVGVKKAPVTYTFLVKQAIEKRVGAKLLPDVLENVTPPEQYELLDLSRISGFVDRARGTGRPTKKDRRALDDFADTFCFFDEDSTLLGAAAHMKFRQRAMDTAKEILDLELKYYREEYSKSTSGSGGFEHLIGKDPKLLELKRTGTRIAQTDFSVLITGETGTGKEVLAKAIHAESPRRDGPFICVNCGAIPDNLLESELFGYEEGAFTGAKKGGKPGKFQLANHGTLFLDEIGDMPLPLQVKILRALQEREIEKVGGGAPMPVDVRVISATRQDLPQMMAEGSFREDLYYRLAVINMETVPLRERPGDILLHANYYLDELNKKYKTKIILSDPVKCCLRQYNWPGNVRELQNVITGAYASCDNLMVEPADLPAKITALHKYDPGLRRQSSRLADTMDAYESAVIREALCRNGQNVKAAAEELGVERSLLYKKMKRLQIVIQRSIH